MKNLDDGFIQKMRQAAPGTKVVEATDPQTLRSVIAGGTKITNIIIFLS